VKSSRAAILLWSALIVGLLVVEFAEITHVFTVPIGSALGDPTTLVFALVFTTILALVGAIFIGIYVSAAVLRAQGFTPFEEEMLRMRTDIREIKAALERAPAEPPASPPKEGGP
jgi:hypothetical protein